MTSELLLIFVVALLVFNPKKWPMVIKHATKVIQYIKHYQALAHDAWKTQTAEIKLTANEEKAKEADALYEASYRKKDL